MKPMQNESLNEDNDERIIKHDDTDNYNDDNDDTNDDDDNDDKSIFILIAY